ncbi:hypothetical protein F5051DRAFT_164749 [Lentinula edodes]|nr:hypothetical protein F5051DRAFT_164749 [Lentinula edodes]
MWLPLPPCHIPFIISSHILHTTVSKTTRIWATYFPASNLSLSLLPRRIGNSTEFPSNLSLSLSQILNMSYSTCLALPAIIPTNGPFHCSFSRGRQGPLREPTRAKCSVLGNDTFVDVDISFLVNLSLPMLLFIDILLDLFTTVLSLSSCAAPVLRV